MTCAMWAVIAVAAAIANPPLEEHHVGSVPGGSYGARIAPIVSGVYGGAYASLVTAFDNTGATKDMFGYGYAYYPADGTYITNYNLQQHTSATNLTLADQSAMLDTSATSAVVATAGSLGVFGPSFSSGTFDNALCTPTAQAYPSGITSGGGLGRGLARSGTYYTPGMVMAVSDPLAEDASSNVVGAVFFYYTSDDVGIVCTATGAAIPGTVTSFENAGLVLAASDGGPSGFNLLIVGADASGISADVFHVFNNGNSLTSLVVGFLTMACGSSTFAYTGTISADGSVVVLACPDEGTIATWTLSGSAFSTWGTTIDEAAGYGFSVSLQAPNMLAIGTRNTGTPPGNVTAAIVYTNVSNNWTVHETISLYPIAVSYPDTFGVQVQLTTDGQYVYVGNPGYGAGLLGDDVGKGELMIYDIATPAPTTAPTLSPTTSPTLSPTVSPTTSPTLSPTTSPADPPTSPTTPPTLPPTAPPTLPPTTPPSASPTAPPTTPPSSGPSPPTSSGPAPSSDKKHSDSTLGLALGLGVAGTALVVGVGYFYMVHIRGSYNAVPPSDRLINDGM